MKYHNTPSYFINGQHRITITIIGAGGTGSLVVTKLARLNEAMIKLNHPGLFINLVDFDIVEENNVGRQLFTENDIGFFKSEALISKINIAFGNDWTSEIRSFKNVDSKANIIISCVDNVKSRIEIMDSFFEKQGKYERDTEKRYYYLDCGNARDYGQVILTNHEKSLKNINDIIFDWHQQDTVEQQGEGCSYEESLEKQDLFINDWCSLYATTILKDLFFKKRIDYQGFFFNTSEFLTSKIKL